MGIEKFRTSQGTFWKVDLEVTAADGRFVRVRKRKVPTRKMAEELASKMRIEAFEGRFFDRPKTATLTVAEVWQAYEPDLPEGQLGISDGDWTIAPRSSPPRWAEGLVLRTRAGPRDHQRVA